MCRVVWIAAVTLFLVGCRAERRTEQTENASECDELVITARLGEDYYKRVLLSRKRTVNSPNYDASKISISLSTTEGCMIKDMVIGEDTIYTIRRSQIPSRVAYIMVTIPCHDPVIYELEFAADSTSMQLLLSDGYMVWKARKS